MCLRSVVPLVTAIGLASSAPAEGRAIDEIAQVDKVTTVSAYGGHVVWSAREPQTGAYRLADLFKGAISYLPVRARSVPFDVDLGPGSDGRPVAAYSRCASEPTDVDFDGLPTWAQAKECSIRVYDFGTGRERRLAGEASGRASHFLPSVWRDRIGFFQTRPGQRRTRGVLVPQLVVRRVGRSARARQLPVGNVPKAPFPARWLTPTALDVGVRRLVFGWEWSSEGHGHGITEVRLLTSTSAHRSLLVAYGVVGEGCLHTVLSPVIDHERITFVRHETCGPASVKRYALASGRRFGAPAPGVPVAFTRDPFAPRDAGTLIAAAKSSEFGGPDACAPALGVAPPPEMGPCTLIQLRGLRFKAEPRRGPLPDSFDLAP